MAYTGQAEDGTEGSLNTRTEISMSTRTRISMGNDLHRSSEKLDKDRDEHQDGGLDEPRPTQVRQETGQRDRWAPK